jgi:L-ascorbate metabolism protein UlaG (beta-lactamase superfamily)
MPISLFVRLPVHTFTAALWATVTLGPMTGCATVEKDRHLSPHYSDGRFHNLDNDDGITEKSFWTLLKWKWFTRRDPDVIENVSDESPAAKNIRAADLIAPPGKIRITWIGHATAFVSFNNNSSITNILTDPIFTGIFTVPRRTDMPLAKEDIPAVDAVVISHSHYDHCDLETLRFLYERNPKLRIIFPEGQKRWAQENGLLEAETLRWWTATNVGEIKVTALPAHHWSFRVPGDRMQFHWASYALQFNHAAVYFAGDTAYSSHFAKIAEKFPEGFAAALMPIGAYSPRWFMKASHVDPPETVQGSIDLHARMILPIHWATFRQSDEKMQEPIEYLAREATRKAVPYQHWVPGESYDIELTASR